MCHVACGAPTPSPPATAPIDLSVKFPDPLPQDLEKGERGPVIQPVKNLDDLLHGKSVACRYLAVLDVVPRPETEPLEDDVRVGLMP